MIIIKSIFAAVVIPENTPVAIYFNEYPADRDGNRLADDDPLVKKLKYYEYGDMIFETENRRYIFKKIYTVYALAANIAEKLTEYSTGETLVVDLDELAEGECAARMEIEIVNSGTAKAEQEEVRVLPTDECDGDDDCSLE